ncbi:ABC transporter ATP-binding protein [Nonomuraea sp. NPDC050022]|uniref:ABC transporter ATP-binding protein n=1 Tax=unclassified Nonomuraea TaxID=2593643 RepID=UPI0034086BFC
MFDIVWRAGRRPALAILLLLTVSGVATASGLLATTAVLEELLSGGPTPDRVMAALPGLALLVGVYALRGGVEAAVTLARARLDPAVRRAAEDGLFSASLAVELTAFDDDGFYDRMHRARDRGLYYLERATGNVVELIGAAFAVAATAIGIGVLHPVLLAVLVLSVLPEGWAVLRAAQQGYEATARMVTLNRRILMLADLATEREPAAEIRACQAQPFLLEEYRRVGDVLREEEVRVALAQARTRTAGRVLAGVATGATLVLLGVLLHIGWIPLAVAGTAVIAIRTATAALNRLVLAANQLFEQALYVSDYETFLEDARTRRPVVGGLPVPAAPRRIGLRGVAFSYAGAGDGRLALSDIDLTIDAGQTIALVGENGSGKTTLAKLIAGLYRPTRGTVTWDGLDLAEMDAAEVVSHVVMVLQHPVRWPHDARVNVRVGRHDKDDPGDVALRTAADLASASEVIDGLPRGWDTLMSKKFRGGQDLSGGQWQRLAVARGLFRDGHLLIWDEPTAPLDAKAEYAVYETLRRVAAGRTVVLITHRLSSVRNADRIYLLHEGRIAEQGTHEQLLAAGGRYADLYHLQAQMYGTSPPITLPTP